MFARSTRRAIASQRDGWPCEAQRAVVAQLATDPANLAGGGSGLGREHGGAAHTAARARAPRLVCSAHAGARGLPDGPAPVGEGEELHRASPEADDAAALGAGADALGCWLGSSAAARDQRATVRGVPRSRAAFEISDTSS